MSAYSTDMIPVSFVGGASGAWRVERAVAVRGDALPVAARVERLEGRLVPIPAGAAWTLHGVTSHTRYTQAAEKRALEALQPGLGRASAGRAALIPIKKSAAWWALAQDERRAIFEESSRHIAVGREYVPAVARRLYHARELGQPFDFLTWFEFVDADAGAFDALLARLRASEEWRFVEREVDLRLSRE